MFERLAGLVVQAVTTGAASAASGEPVDASELSGALLVERALAWERAARALTAAQLVDIAAFDTAQRAADRTDKIGSRLQGRTVNPEIAINLAISTTAAASKVAFARSVVDDHTALLQVLADGLISEWHLRVMVTATDELTPEQKDVVAQQLAAQIRARHARGAMELTPYQLGQAATRLAIAIDPDAATRRYERVRRHREVSVTNRSDGACALWVKGPAEQTQHMYDQVERDARTRRHDGDDRDMQTIMFEQIYDTLTGLKPWVGPAPQHQGDHEAGSSHEMAEPTAAGGSSTGIGAIAVGSTWRPPDLGAGDLDPDDPAHDTYCDNTTLATRAPVGPVLTRRSPHLEVQVVMSATTLLGLDEQPALLRGYGAIPAEVARRIADTTSRDDLGTLRIRRLFCDPTDGRLLTMESSSRLFTGPLRAFAIYRDHHCRLSGATIRDIDHVTPARHRGATAAQNGQSLARNAHVLRDHPGVHVRTKPPPANRSTTRHPDDVLDGLRANAPDIDWTLPTGRTYTSEPPPALGHGQTPRPFTSLVELHLEELLHRARDSD